jgi:hypothetical protein
MFTVTVKMSLRYIDRIGALLADAEGAADGAVAGVRMARRPWRRPPRNPA